MKNFVLLTLRIGLNQSLSSKVEFVDLKNVTVSYVRKASGNIYIALAGNHSTLPQIRYAFEMYIAHPTVKCRLVQSNDYGATWVELWVDKK